jgi:hypothetical protein
MIKYKSGVGSTWSPQQYRSGLYFEPAKNRRAGSFFKGAGFSEGAPFLRFPQKWGLFRGS